MRPKVKHAVIIGVGQIGGSLGLALKKANFFPSISCFDHHPKRLKLAAAIFDICYENMDEAISKSDMVILATPIHHIVEMLDFGFKKYPEKLYTDVGSTKSPMKEVEKKYTNVRLIGGHPFAGSEKEGESGWNDSLFKDKPYFWIPGNKHDEKIVVDMIKAVGAIPISVSALEHDQAMAMTSHLPLLLSLSLMSLFSDRKEKLQSFVGGGFQSMTRLTGGSPLMGKDILISNKNHVLSELDHFFSKLDEIKKYLENDEENSLLAVMQSYQNLYWEITEKNK